MLAAWLALVVGTSSAEQLPVRAYGIEDGLAGDTITDIVQDGRGYLWIATTDGVSRFDGGRFTSYGSSDGLPHARVHALLEGRDGTWWIATHGGLARFLPDRPAGRPAFERVALGSLMTEKTPEPIFSLHEDRAGRLWAGGAGRLFVLEPGEAGRVQEIGLEALPARPQTIDSFAETPDGSLWIGTQQGLLRRLPDGRTSFQPVLPHHGDDRVLDLEVDRKGRLWVVHLLRVFVFKPGVFKPDPEGLRPAVARPSLAEAAAGRGCRITIDQPAPLPLRAGEVCELGNPDDDTGWRKVLRSGDQMRLVSNRGMFLWDGRLRRWTEDNGLVDSSLTAVAEDRDGNLWLGTEGRGVMRVARHGFIGYTANEGLANPQVLSIFQGGDGALYVHSGNTYQRELWLHRFDGSRLAAVRPRLPPQIAYLGWSVHQSAVLDRSGGWWIATGQGLLRYPAGTRFEDLGSVLPAVIAARDGLGGNSVERIFEDSRGDLWIATNGARPLTQMARATGKLRSFGREEGLAAESVPSALAEDRAGQIWIGLEQGGVLRLNPKGPGSARLERFGPEHGLPDAPVTDLHVDARGRLWIATEGGGLGRLEAPSARSPRFVRLTTLQGIASNEVRCLAEDRWGRIFAGGHRGIDRLDPETGRIEHFTTLDGLASNLIDTAGQDREGHLWFGTRQGLSQLVPVREPISLVPSPWITGVSVNGVPQRVSELGAPRVEGIEMEARRSRLEIEFLALSFAPGESLRYQVQMEGFDRDWNPASGTRSVVYAHLPAGHYRFLVRAVTREDRAASVVPAEVLIVVRPPLWRRAWFLILATLALAAGIVALYRYRVSHLLAVERMRTRIATDLHDDLGSSLSRISILSELARRRAQGDTDGTRLVTDIGETAREMMGALGESIWAIDPRRDDLRSLATRIRRFAGDLLESRGVVWNLQAPADAEEIKLSPVERRQLYLVFKEALHNVERHASASSVSMSLAVKGTRLTAIIRDDGRGFDEPAEGETRHGLGSMSARAADLKGRLTIDSASGRGTEVRLEVPLTGRNA
ncbi:MAG TPA: two-component regulator propeller domain-containing protein [Thermoanaerobaculia bacterium]|nr:two-component regulator propeller domain-containing protein [Thermoanaerobaculia bacterium]